MAIYNKVLVAIDTTAEADEVIAAAQAVAKQHAAELFLMTVIQPLTQAYGGYGAMGSYAGYPDIEAQIQDNARAMLKTKAETAGVDNDHVHLSIGRPASEIKTHAQQMGADLIVLGSHCRRGLGVLLGSTAGGVLHGAPCDVLTVRIED